MVNNH